MKVAFGKQTISKDELGQCFADCCSQMCTEETVTACTKRYIKTVDSLLAHIAHIGTCCKGSVKVTL